MIVPSDEELVVGAGRDVDGFGDFYTRHVRELLGFFVRRTADAQVAADLTGETFAAAFVARQKFRAQGPGSARAWLFGIARRVLGHYLRRQSVSDRYRRKLGMTSIVVDDANALRVEELADLASIRGALRDALSSLPANQLDAIRLRVIEEMPYRDVALRLGCTEGAARVRVARGLARMAEVIEQ